MNGEPRDATGSRWPVRQDYIEPHQCRSCGVRYYGMTHYCLGQRSIAPHGCICPPTSELTCRGVACPRRGVAMVTDAQLAAAENAYRLEARCPDCIAAPDKLCCYQNDRLNPFALRAALDAVLERGP